MDTHEIIINGVTYFIQGSDTETLKEIACIIGLKYDSIEPSKLPAHNSIIKVWVIGELADYIIKFLHKLCKFIHTTEITPIVSFRN